MSWQVTMVKRWKSKRISVARFIGGTCLLFSPALPYPPSLVLWWVGKKWGIEFFLYNSLELLNKSVSDQLWLESARAEWGVRLSASSWMILAKCLGDISTHYKIFFLISSKKKSFSLRPYRVPDNMIKW